MNEQRLTRIEERLNDLLRRLAALEREAERDRQRFQGLRFGVLWLLGMASGVGLLRYFS